jgi:hypothetical protein
MSRTETHIVALLSTIKRTACWLTFAMIALLSLDGFAQTKDRYDAAREKLIENAIKGSGIKDERVLRAMRSTDRHEFVPASQRKLAYEDMALSQTRLAIR